MQVKKIVPFRHVARETVPDMLGVRLFNGDGEGGGSGSGGGNGGGSGGSGSGASDGGQGQQNGQGQQSGGQGGGSGTGGGQSQGGGQQQGQGSSQGGGKQKINVDDLPPEVQALIRDVRKDAGDTRQKKNQAETALETFKDQVAVALGLKPDESKDPEKLAGKLADSRRETQDANTQLAVVRHASDHEADVGELLDSTSFMAKVRALDYSASDFGQRVSDAIKDAVTSNRAKYGAKASGNGGGGATGRQIGQGNQGSSGGPAGVARGRALRQERRKPRQRQNQNNT